MSTILATKSDLAALRDLLEQKIDTNRASLEHKIDNNWVLLEQKIDSSRSLLEHKIELLRSSMTVRLGSMQVVAAGLLFAALKLT